MMLKLETDFVLSKRVCAVCLLALNFLMKRKRKRKGRVAARPNSKDKQNNLEDYISCHEGCLGIYIYKQCRSIVETNFNCLPNSVLLLLLLKNSLLSNHLQYHPL